MVSQTNSHSKPPAPSSHRATADRWSVWLGHQADVDSWTPWLEFVDSARVLLDADADFYVQGVDRPSTLWRAVSPSVLESLADLGLSAEVVATTGVVPVADHPGDLAGHVRMRHNDSSRRAGSEADEDLTAEQVLIGSSHALVPAVVPRATLRQFVGQWAPETEPQLNLSLLRWFDHALSWTDSAGAPVLSIEPSTDWHELWTEITAALLLHDLPLALQGPHSGVRSEDGSLFLLRFDPGASPVPAEHVTGTPWTTAEPRWSPAALAAECRGGYNCVSVACQACGRCDCAVPVCPRCLCCAEHALFGEGSSCYLHLWWSPSENRWLEATS